MNRGHTLRSIGFWLSSLAACADGSDSGPSGEHVEFFLEGRDHEICAGTIAQLDRYVERVAEFLGMSLPPEFRVPIHTGRHRRCKSACYVPEEDAIYLAGLDTTGRVIPDGVIRHELAHAVFERLLGHGSPFFNEGLAESLTKIARTAPRPGQPVGDMLDRPAVDVDYAEAAHFVRFLIDTRGIERFIRLYRAVKEGDSRSRVVARFADVYGEDFSKIEKEYVAGAPRCGYQLDVCDALEVEPAGSEWSVALAASCLDPEFFGADGGAFGTEMSIRFEFSGRYRFRMTPLSISDPSGRPVMSVVRMIRCGDCTQQFTFDFFSDEVEFELQAGLYTFVFLPAGDSVMRFEVEYVGS